VKWVFLALAVFAAVAVIILGSAAALARDLWWLLLLVFAVGLLSGWASYRPERREGA